MPFFNASNTKDVKTLHLTENLGGKQTEYLINFVAHFRFTIIVPNNEDL